MVRSVFQSVYLVYISVYCYL
uniref:Uncharacterized protein n=1 Tax=Anguilla anguilla TaxID=7936 RepID=A0A0E9V5F6_ANGAN